MKAIPELDPTSLNDLALGFQKSQILFTAAALDLFSHLQEPATAEHVVAKTGTNPELTEKLLNALVAIGLASKKNDTFVSTELAAACLVPGGPLSQTYLIRLMAMGFGPWAGLPAALEGKEPGRKGPAEREAAFDKGFIVSMAEGALRGGLQKTVEAVSKLPDFAGARRLLDLGGGHGLYAIGFAAANEALKAVVFDLPPVIEVAREYIQQHEAQERVGTVAGNFMSDDLGEDYDIIFVSDSFYLPKDNLPAVLSRVRQALRDGGLLILKHWVLNPDGTGEPTVVLWDLWLSLLGHPHHTYSTDEYKEALKQGGFTVAETFDISTSFDPTVVIVGRKEA